VGGRLNPGGRRPGVRVEGAGNVSGPLADQVLRHAPQGLGLRTRAVLMKLAIRADHDGSGADVSVRALVHDLAISTAKAREALDELDRLGLAPVVEHDAKGGRGHVTRRRVFAQPCDRPGRCQPCEALADLLEQAERDSQGTPSGRRRPSSRERDSQGTPLPAGPPEERDSQGTPSGEEAAGKGFGSALKGSAANTPTYDVATAPLGGAVAVGGSDDRPAAGSAQGAGRSGSGGSEPATPEPVEAPPALAPGEPDPAKVVPVEAAMPDVWQAIGEDPEAREARRRQQAREAADARAAEQDRAGRGAAAEVLAGNGADPPAAPDLAEPDPAPNGQGPPPDLDPAAELAAPCPIRGRPRPPSLGQLTPAERQHLRAIARADPDHPAPAVSRHCGTTLPKARQWLASVDRDPAPVGAPP
jgi:hypothetical protein